MYCILVTFVPFLKQYKQNKHLHQNQFVQILGEDWPCFWSHGSRKYLFRLKRFLIQNVSNCNFLMIASLSILVAKTSHSCLLKQAKSLWSLLQSMQIDSWATNIKSWRGGSALPSYSFRYQEQAGGSQQPHQGWCASASAPLPCKVSLLRFCAGIEVHRLF